MTKTIVLGDVQLLDKIEVSEPGNAVRLALLSKGEIHYVDTWNTWIVYRDGRWEVDGGGVGLQWWAKQVPQKIFQRAGEIKDAHNDAFDIKEADRTPEQAHAVSYYDLHISWARRSNTDSAIKRMVNLARDLPGIRIVSDDLDSQPFLLNLQNGTFDFKTGEFRDHDPGDLLTKMASVRYDPMATCPMWERCVEQWQPDISKQRFLQEITGSGLIGEPIQNLFINVGGGRNGKGTFYKTIQRILADYANTAPEDMLIETRWRVHDEEKARLRGCRFLLAPETAVGERIDEAGVKNMTGGDMMHARHLYGRPFDFMPTHTAFLHTNYEPQIRGTDPAIWNRVVKIIWNTFIKEDERDRYIDYKLDAERSGILNWLVAGCERWIKDGLRKPPSIIRDTEGYRAEQDHVGRFLVDSMSAMVLDAASLGPVAYMPASIIRKHYEQWCLSEGMKPWVTANVGKELRNKGWEPYVQKVGKTSIRAWKYQNSESDVTGTPSDQGPGYTDTAITPLFPLNLKEEKDVVVDVNKEVILADAVIGVSDVTDEWEPSEEQQEQRHREWLYDHGYPVPPTEEEIERDQATRVYEDPHQPDWVE